jgi:hypothetical protein
MAIDPQLGSIIAAGGTVLGGFVMWVGQRRSGKLTLTDQQSKYINDQQEDITNLRDELDDFREWAVDVIHIAANVNLKLPPVPRRRRSHADERKEHAG